MFGAKKEKEAAVVPVKTESVVEAAEPVTEVERPVPVAPRPAPAPARPRTLIGTDIRFIGNIESTEDIEINGRVEGDIRSGNAVTITKGGSVRGDVYARSFSLHGSCEGNATVQSFCRIGRDGSFFGELRTSTLITEDGCGFEGVLHLNPSKPAAQPEPKAAPEPKPEPQAAPEAATELPETDKSAELSELLEAADEAAVSEPEKAPELIRPSSRAKHSELPNLEDDPSIG